MEPAPQDSKMVSLATFDTTESGSASPREPLLASITRVSSVNNLTADSLAPIDKVQDTAQAQSTAPAPAAEIRHLSPSSHAASIFKSLPAELEKFQQTGSNQLQLDIPMGDQESVRIRLSLRAGELHSTFITESPELREALQRAWPEFAQHSRDRGYRLGDPSFQQSFQGNDTTSGQNNRRNRDSHDDTPAALSGSFPSRKSGQPRPSNDKQSTNTALWA
jgi:flagellar hook-length control protein FliK